MTYAKDIMTDKVYFLKETDNLATMRNLLLSKKISHIIILNDKGNLCGIVTKRDLIDFICSHFGESDLTKIPVSKIMKNKIITCGKYEMIEDIIEKMLSNNISAIPVVEKNKILGIISKKDILKYLRDLELNYPIEKYVIKKVITIHPENTIIQAAKKMLENKIKKLVVIEGKRPTGVLSEKDIVFFNFSGKKKIEINERKVKFVPGIVRDVMSEPVITCNKDSKINEVINKMLENKVSSCVVLDNNEEIYGIITITDVLRSYLDYSSNE